jgi:YfiH family protein
MRSSDFVLHQTQGIKWLSFPALDAHSSIIHGFLLKNQSLLPDIKTKQVDEFLKGIDSRERKPVSLSQMHQDECVIVTSEDRLKRRYKGDALLTNRDDVLVCVEVADCLPIFLPEERKKTIGLVHAGWRGTLLGIARRSIQRAKRRLGCHPGQFTVLFGPCIGTCCYQVSEDAGILFDEECIRPCAEGGLMLDLIRANMKQLVDCGVKEDRIFVTDRCTCCDAELFCSYRREGEGVGKMIGFMGLRRK